MAVWIGNGVLEGKDDNGKPFSIGYGKTLPACIDKKRVAELKKAGKVADNAPTVEQADDATGALQEKIVELTGLNKADQAMIVELTDANSRAQDRITELEGKLTDANKTIADLTNQLTAPPAAGDAAGPKKGGK
jgi:chromosome segregation ATPase